LKIDQVWRSMFREKSIGQGLCCNVTGGQIWEGRHKVEEFQFVLSFALNKLSVILRALQKHSTKRLTN